MTDERDPARPPEPAQQDPPPPAPGPDPSASVWDPWGPPTTVGEPPSAGADAAYAPMPPGEGWDPITANQADGGYAGQSPAWAGHHPAATAPQQKGPGWGALVAVAAVASNLVIPEIGGRQLLLRGQRRDYLAGVVLERVVVECLTAVGVPCVRQLVDDPASYGPVDPQPVLDERAAA